MAKKFDTFEECWRYYINGPKDLEHEGPRRLEACMNTASTLDEVCRVFNAAMTDPQYDSVGHVRVRSIQRAIELVSNEAEARRIYTLASKKKRDGKFYFPARERDAKAKLENFSQHA